MLHIGDSSTLEANIATDLTIMLCDDAAYISCISDDAAYYEGVDL